MGFSCPYRKRNPAMFNVRDYSSCALSAFPSFPALKFVTNLRDDVKGEANETFIPGVTFSFLITATHIRVRDVGTCSRVSLSCKVIYEPRCRACCGLRVRSLG